MAGTFVWVDIPVRDLNRATSFYSAVTARSLETMRGEGFELSLFQHQREDTAGCLYVPGPDNQPSTTGPLVYLDVSGRLDAAIAAVEPHGGHIVKPKHSIQPHGFCAIVVDSEGNRIALHSPTA